MKPNNFKRYEDDRRVNGHCAERYKNTFYKKKETVSESSANGILTHVLCVQLVLLKQLLLSLTPVP